ncbi:C39 family peptidase [Plantactinospora sp. CA-290183]|uniref:C39 family peptidase n=1 Tax=Plantactinospora sp. CA-290183 TaxID=3240006 RepID=UPI003D8C8829
MARPLADVPQRIRNITTGRRNRLALGSAAVLAAAAATIGIVLTSVQPPAPSEGGSTVAVAELGGSVNQAPGAGAGGQQSAPADPTSPATAEPTTSAPKAAPSATGRPAAPESKVLDYDFEAQTTYYYCGPAATRIALTARDVHLSQDEVAGRLGTTTSGTNSAEDTTRVLNSAGRTDFYRTTMIRGGAASPAQMDQLQADVVHAVSNGYPVVANIAGSTTDTDGGWHSYPGGHYLTVVGYRDDGRTVKIADPAIPGSDSTYWMSTIDLANWAATRGYSS